MLKITVLDEKVKDILALKRALEKYGVSYEEYVLHLNNLEICDMHDTLKRIEKTLKDMKDNTERIGKK
ncbi:hypothetical protein DSECCO2_336300 [anaerobic digester metagenome]